MNHRFLVSGKLAVMMAVVSLATVAVAGQGPSVVAKRETAAKAWSPRRTPDGQPDLQGFWTVSTNTPLQRPSNITKEFYSKEEAAELEEPEFLRSQAAVEARAIETFSQAGVNVRPMASPAKPGAAPGPVAPRITVTKMKVITASNTKAALSEYSPR